MIKAVIFDMDGLLIDSEPLWQETEREIMRTVGLELTPEMQIQTFGLQTDEALHHWYVQKPWEEPGMKEVLEEFYRQISDKIIRHGALLPGVHEVLDFFRKREIPIAVASSSPRSIIDLVLEHFELDPYIELSHSSEDEDYGKPHPAVYLTTANLLDTPPAQCLAFEDSFNGLIAAVAARMKAVAIPDPRHRDDPRYSLADLKLNKLTDFNEKLFNRLNE